MRAGRQAVAPDKMLRQNGIHRIPGKHATKAACLLEDVMVKLLHQDTKKNLLLNWLRNKNIVVIFTSQILTEHIIRAAVTFIRLCPRRLAF